MLLSDLFENFDSRYGKIGSDIGDALPPVIVIKDLDNSNSYQQYRFMTDMAAARAVAAGEVPFRPVQPWTQYLTMIGYTAQDLETIRLAAKQAGFAIDEISHSLSREPDWVNNVSPVMKFKMMEAEGDGDLQGKVIEPKSLTIDNLSPADDRATPHQATPTRGLPQVLVLYPGRFQPLHRGHKAVYDELVKKFGPTVYIATSNKTDADKSPFDFADKLKMARAAGIPADKIVQVKNPYQADEIKALYAPDNTVLVFAVGQKDMDEDPRFQFNTDGPALKKDGTPAYMQKWVDLSHAKTMDQHGYVIAAPTVEFDVLGKPATSATQVRAAYRAADPATRDQIVKDLYGKTSGEIRNMFDDKLGGEVDEDQDAYLQNPLDPEGDTNGPGKTGDAFTDDNDPVQLDDMNESKSLYTTDSTGISRNDLLDAMSKFLVIAKEEIGLEKLPKIHWSWDDKIAPDSPSFGRFTHTDQSIKIIMRNRHPIDIMRTLAHELVHYKQDVERRIGPDSGETGSPIENEANAMAGQIMRRFDQENPELFGLGAVLD